MPRRPAVARRALLACALLTCALTASAEETVLSKSLEACRAEIDAFCTKITPGNGRVVACLYAHQGELSGRCDLVLFDAAAELQQIMGAMQRVAEVCKRWGRESRTRETEYIIRRATRTMRKAE